ncbi:YpiF family protein [Bacillus marasmi]|uniref:YpiF family protein n=1 Tax=Bacillus marasmi TaxID=1926279 RepID=UPI0011CA0EF5|nr:YpiF family protein [Bacillus marasmi]
MKWNPEDVEIFQKAKEYVDTAVIPLLPVTFNSGEMGQAAGMSEFITLLSGQLERQFKGRIFLFPGHAYLKEEVEEKLLEDLLKWESKLLENGFSHVFYLTSDYLWKSVESRLSGSVIWLPAIPMETMQEAQKVSVVESQVKQLLMMFTEKWNKNE